MKKYFTSLLLLIFLCASLGKVGAEEALTWKDCIKEAAKHHPDLIAAEEVVVQSVAEKKITASTLYPQIDASLDASTARSANDKQVATKADSYNYGVSGTQLIFDGTKTINNVRAAGETINASKQAFKFTSVTVRYNLRSAFIDLLRTQENLNITQQIFDIRRSNLELITLRYESGLEHKGALMTAQADSASANYQINQAKRNVEVAQRKLTKEMGREQLVPMLIKGGFEVKEAVKNKPDFAVIAQKHPSLLQIVAQKNSAQYGVKSAFANFSPTLTAQSGANKNGTEWSPRGDQWNLGLSLSMPIFEGGLRLAQVSQAKALLIQLKENERSTRDGIVLTLEQSWAALQDAVENVGVERQQLEATEVRSKISQAQYSIGFISFDNWTIIEDNLVQAKSTYLNAQAQALLAEAKWIQAKGETLEYEE